ncbi:hypothetical protein CDEF62S_00543 [Castellaniella defragrans]
MHSNLDTRMLVITHRAAREGIGALSLGEALTAALVLDRRDWLRERGYSIADALDRIGPDWAARVPAVARQFETDLAQARLRYSFEILPRKADGEGYLLRLLDQGQEVGCGHFPARGKSVRFADDQCAYDEAHAAGLAWLDGKQAAELPALQH